MASLVAQRIKDRRKELGYSAEYLADKLGINRSTVYRYEAGEIDSVDVRVAYEYSRILGVSIGYLMGWTDDKYDYKEDLSQPNSHFNAVCIPLLGTIAAGLPILAEENIEDHFYIDARMKADFALRIKGDSMIDAGIFENDVVFLKRQDDLENGQIGAVLVEDEATLKKFYRDGSTIVLQSENDKYRPIILTNGNVRILGKLVAVLNFKDTTII